MQVYVQNCKIESKVVILEQILRLQLVRHVIAFSTVDWYGHSMYVY